MVQSSDSLPVAGVAVSGDGINWQRGYQRITGERGPAQGPDVGEVLWPNPDWWWHDTCHLTLGDVQVCLLPCLLLEIPSNLPT
jgi:hypothetical protein